MFNFNKNNNNPVIQIEWYTFSAHSSYSSDQPRDGHKRKEDVEDKRRLLVSSAKFWSVRFLPSWQISRIPGFNSQLFASHRTAFRILCILCDDAPFFSSLPPPPPSTCVCPCCSSVLRCADRIIIKSSRISAASLWILFIVLFILVPNY